MRPEWRCCAISRSVCVRVASLVLGGVKRQVLDVMQRTGLAGAMGEANVFATDKAAIESLLARIDRCACRSS